MKKHLRRFILLLTIPSLSASAASAQQAWDGTSADTEWEGDGTADSPYLIGTADELAGLAKRTNDGETFEGKFFRLTADVSLSDPAADADKRPLWTSIGSYNLTNDDPETNPGGFYNSQHWFKGTFDGDGHTISNLWYSGTTDWDDWNDPFGSGQLDFTAWNKALFGCLDGATIRNLRLTDANIAGTAMIGGVTVLAYNTTFTDVSVQGSFKSGDLEAGGSAAAIAVEARDSHFSNCSANANVYGRSNSGALVGVAYGNTTIENCTAAGEVSCAVNAGGLIGATAASPTGTTGPAPVITGCTSSAFVTVLNARNQGNNGGGFIGYNGGTVSRCVASGNVHVTANSGAAFCADNAGTIDSSCATGNVYNEEYGVWLSQFVVNNGYDAGNDDARAGRILNCFGTGSLTAPAAPGDAVATPTNFSRFVFNANLSAGSVIANCYFDNTTNSAPTTQLFPGVSAATTTFMQSEQFVNQLNCMAAVMGLCKWQYNAGGYPTPTDTPASDVAPFFGGGTGTAADPFIIVTKEHLANLSLAVSRNWEFSGQHLSQTADIALNAPMEQWGDEMPEEWPPIGAQIEAATGSEDPLCTHFSGIYDGGGHTVANMYIDNNAGTYSGLFGVLGGGAIIRNLGVTDAWVESSKGYTGILAGVSAMQNDTNKGDRTITNCWTSGQVNGIKNYTGGIVGAANGGYPVFIDGCYSTAETNGYGIIGYMYPGEGRVAGSWFGGKVNHSSDHLPYYSGDNCIDDYFDIDKNPVNPGTYVNDCPTGLTTAQMQAKEFVNNLNYAAAANGFAGGWCWNKDAYPSFKGESPSLEITVEDGVGEPYSFLAFEGSTLSAPKAPRRDGYILVGWYTNAALTQPFTFGKETLTAPVILYAKWAQPVNPDYSVFKNKFAKTYTISTAAQLMAFSNIVNGEDQANSNLSASDIEGKTVKLGADIIFNDVAGYDSWAADITPQAFTPVGYQSNAPFKGTFDGQGHTITGLFFETIDANSYAHSGLFGYIAQEANVSNVILKNTFVRKNRNARVALFAFSVSGTVANCGAEGRICDSSTDLYPEGNAGLICTTESTAKVSRCYADVEITTSDAPVGGLVNDNKGTLENCYAVGKVTFTGAGAFGGVAGSISADFTNCYSAIDLTFGKQNSSPNVGGAYGYKPYGATYNPGIYDRDLVSAAFGMLGLSYVKPFDKGTGLTTENMKKMISFAGWDFDNIWGRRNDINNGYPYLRWTNPGKTNDPDNSGIESVEADSAAEITEWYNINGMRIDRPSAPGIYIIRRADGTTAKLRL